MPLDTWRHQIGGKLDQVTWRHNIGGRVRAHGRCRARDHCKKRENSRWKALGSDLVRHRSMRSDTWLDLVKRKAWLIKRATWHFMERRSGGHTVMQWSMEHLITAKGQLLQLLADVGPTPQTRLTRVWRARACWWPLMSRVDGTLSSVSGHGLCPLLFFTDLPLYFFQNYINAILLSHFTLQLSFKF